MNNKDEIFSSIFFRCVKNTNLCFSEEEFNAMIPYVKRNKHFASKWISDASIRRKLKMYQKVELLKNIDIDIDILLSNKFFDFCSKTELIMILSSIDDKNTIKKIIDITDVKNISIQKIKNNEKKEYIQSLLIAKKISNA